MKYWLNTLKAALLLSGAVMGAGFLSGRELVFFFGTEGFLPFLLIAGGVLFSLPVDNLIGVGSMSPDTGAGPAED